MSEIVPPDTITQRWHNLESDIQLPFTTSEPVNYSMITNNRRLNTDPHVVYGAHMKFAYYPSTYWRLYVTPAITPTSNVLAVQAFVLSRRVKFVQRHFKDEKPEDQHICWGTIGWKTKKWSIWKMSIYNLEEFTRMKFTEEICQADVWKDLHPLMILSSDD